MSDEQNQTPPGLLPNLPEWLIKKERGHVKKAKEIIMTLRRQGMTKEQISVATGIPPGTLSGALSQWAIEAKERDQAQRDTLERKAKIGDQLGGEDGSGDLDLQAALDQLTVDVELPTSNAGMSDLVDKILRKGLMNAARTVALAAGNAKIDSQALAGAKLLLKKYGMLQEEYEAKESQYVKMNAVELCERSVAAALAVARSKGAERMVSIMQRAMDEIMEAKEERSSEAA